MRSMMQFGTMLSQGELVLIPVPFTDLSSQKRRPVSIISSTPYNRISRDVIVVAVTSNLAIVPHSLPLASADPRSGTLKRTSRVRVDRIYTLEQSLIVKSFVILKSEAIDRIHAEIQTIFAK